MLGMIVFKLDRHRPRLQAHLAQAWPNGRTTRALLMAGALLHDCGKPATRTVDESKARPIRFFGHDEAGAELAHTRISALHLSSDEVERITAVVRGHMRPHFLRESVTQEGKLSSRAIYRFWRSLGKAGIDVCLLAMADWLGTGSPDWELAAWLSYLDVIDTLLDGYFNRRETLIAPPPLADGNKLMHALAIPPGPVIGALLDKLTEAQVSGEIQTVDEAIALAQQLYTELGAEGLIRGRMA